MSILRFDSDLQLQKKKKEKKEPLTQTVDFSMPFF